ncbi:hypothetical protein FKW77_005095 [Venturia effusa]|uniref:Uncharacterized protein n=1 Tax=Venturia effusa TaxID=50376 RepID=A0A517LQ88_9PEZI|nr:hypothetical protein FKW77_005095 [Venturia effusa]
MAKSGVSFLDLPSELRQKIIAETYDIVHFIKRYAYSFNGSGPIATSKFLQRGNYVLHEKKMQPKTYHKSLYYRDCKAFVKGVRSWTRTLKQVDERLMDDVEYVQDKFGNGSGKLLVNLRRIGFNLCE